MAYQATFQRYELKYLLTQEQKANLPEAMASYVDIFLTAKKTGTTEQDSFWQ